MTRDPSAAADADGAPSSAQCRRALVGVIIAAVLLGPTFHLLQRPLAQRKGWL